jgi:hypothetical protein
MSARHAYISACTKIVMRSLQDYARRPAPKEPPAVRGLFDPAGRYYPSVEKAAFETGLSVQQLHDLIGGASPWRYATHDEEHRRRCSNGGIRPGMKREAVAA